MKEFDVLCQDYGIIHKFTTPTLPQFNCMVKRLIQIIKHGLIVLFLVNIQGWDIQLPRIFFGYNCGVQVSTRYLPYMVLIGHSPILAANNNLNGLCELVDE
jgi:hypothetical protein